MAMPRTKSTTLFLALAALVALSFSTGDACDNVPSMSIIDACNKACSNASPARVQLCQSTLLAAGVAHTAEVTVYAVAAAKAAQKSYNSSMTIINRLLDIPTLPNGEKSAYVFCQNKYMKAMEYMIAVTNQMSLCVFAYPRQEYLDSTVVIDTCGVELTNYTSSPLHDANNAALNSTFVAFDLGGLIVGK